MMKSQGKQAGGTLIGMIIGLVIGLGAAVVVALMITKAPMPFLSKGFQTEKITALLPGQLTDPNKPMYGKQEAAKEAARDFAKEQAAEAKPADAKPAEAKIVETKSAPVVTPATPQPEDKFIYYLQAGAFRDMADAEGVRGKLALQGVEAGISERPSETGTLYRVRVGPFSQLDAMNRVRSKLADSGMDVAVVRSVK
jgi:cell division protein FtsN